VALEIVFSKLRPDLVAGADSRPDVRSFDKTPEQLARDILVSRRIIADAAGPTMLLDQVSGSKPAIKRGQDDSSSVGSFSADFKNKEALTAGHRQTSAVSE
jgi:hypothetical protein